MPASHLALLRGINVGGKNKLPMNDLRALFIAAGCRDVQTFIQSGNVLFEGEPDLVAALPGAITAAIAEHYRYRVPVILRTADEMEAIVRDNPFVAQGANAEALHVLFLANRPDAGRVAGLDADCSPPDRFIVHGQEVYLYLPNGAGRTKLTTDYFDARLATTSTGRNWRTVTTLSALMAR